MFRMWGKIFHNNHLIQDHVIELSDLDKSRTHKVFQSLEELSDRFDLPVPIWLDSNIKEFKRGSKTRFYQDSFVESIDFDYLEIQIIEEDE